MSHVIRCKNAALLLLAACAFVPMLARAAEATPQMKVRKPAVAGAWYPADKAGLGKMIEQFLSKAPAFDLGKPVALISPHAGYTYSGQTAAYGFKAAGQFKYRRVIVMGPSHAALIQGASIPDFTHFQTPLGLIELDRPVCDELLKHPPFRALTPAHIPEHSIEAQLPFLQKAIGDFKLVPIIIQGVDATNIKQIAAALAPFADDDTLIVVSSDFTHSGTQSGYVPYTKDVKENLRKLNHDAYENIAGLDPARFAAFLEQTGATICGAEPILVLMELLKSRKDNLEAKLLDYRTSGDLSGDYESYCVAYESIVFYRKPENPKAASAGEGAPKMLSAEAKKKLLKIARSSVEAAVKRQPIPKLQADEPELQQKCGAFVTLKTHGELRGCLGQFTSDQPLYSLVSQMAVSSALEDPRFVGQRLTPEELSDLDIEISVLSPLKRLKEPMDFELGKQGIYIKRGFRTGCFLPQVATETGWSKEEFLSYCCTHKAGLAADAWADPGTEVYAFDAEVIDEREVLPR